MATSPNDGWGPCPQGSFQKLSGRLAARRQRALAFTVLGGLAAALVTGVTAAAVTEHIISSMAASNQSNVCPTHAPAPAPECPPDQKALQTVPAK
jgi:hypothetical protein